MNNRIKYNIDEYIRNAYRQMPNFLFEGEFSGKNISNDARVLYTLLRDRHELSFKNKWVDDEGYIYLVYSRDSMCQMLGLSKNYVTKIIKELKDFQLIDEKQMGLGKPNRIFLLAPAVSLKSLGNGLNPQTPTGRDSELPREGSLESHAEGANKININNITELKNISSTPILSVLGKEEKEKTEERREEKILAQAEKVLEQVIEREKGIIADQQKKEGSRNVDAHHSTQHLTEPSPKYNYNDVEKFIKSNIEYDNLLGDKAVDTEILEEICRVMVNTICNDFKDGYVSMGNEKVPHAVVKSVFLKLDREQIEYFVESFGQQTEHIGKPVAYIRTALYRNYQTCAHHMTNRVHVDLPWLATPKPGNKKENEESHDRKF